MMSDGAELKWCGLCGSWTDHYPARHPAENTEGDEVGYVVTEAMDDGDIGDETPTPGAFARLRDAGLI